MLEEDGFPAGHWGYIDTDGELVLDYQFDDAHSFSEGLAAVEIDADGGFDTATGYIDKDGEVVIDTDFHRALSFSEGLAPVTRSVSDDWIYIDESGNQVLPESGEYDFTYPFDGPLARISVSGGSPSWGTNRGELEFEDPLDEEYAYIDREGQQVWPDED